MGDQESFEAMAAIARDLSECLEQASIHLARLAIMLSEQAECPQVHRESGDA